MTAASGTSSWRGASDCSQRVGGQRPPAWPLTLHPDAAAHPHPPAQLEPRQPPVKASPRHRRFPPCRDRPHCPRPLSRHPRLSLGTCPCHPQRTWPCLRWTSCPRVSALRSRDAQHGGGGSGEVGAACGALHPPLIPGVLQRPMTSNRHHWLCLTLRIWPHRHRPPLRTPPGPPTATWRKVQWVP